MSASLPCIVCRTLTERVFEHELQPSEATAFSSNGHYGSTAFDPMDLSELVVVICDDCLTRAGRDGIVALDQPRIGLAMDIEGADYSVGYYRPEREHVIWNPETHYRQQAPSYVEPEEVAALNLPRSAMIAASAVEFARKEVERLSASTGGTIPS